MTGTPTFQRPIESVPQGTWDVIVAGAGPAGSVAALHLASRGHRVLLVERHAFPRDQACGDLLIKDSLDCLRRAGLYERVRSHAQPTDAALVSSPSKIEWLVEGEFMVVRRRKLDLLLAERASEAGAIVCRGKVESIEVRPDGTVQASIGRAGQTVVARAAVIATGADTRLAEQLGMLTRRMPTAVALRQYVRSEASLKPLVFSFARRMAPGYGWIFPLPGGWYNIGCGVVCNGGSRPKVDLHATLQAFYEVYPAAAEIRAGATKEESVHGARLRAGLYGVRFVGPGNVVAVGETVGTTYPFTGEGIGKAMESGELAAAALDEALSEHSADALVGYDRRMEELRPKYFGYERAQRWLSHPILNDLVALRARRSQYLRAAAAALVSETDDPRAIFSIRGLLTSLWR